LDHEAFRQFLNQPYLLMPRRQDSWYIVVPKFVDMQLGWLEWTTPSYNVFVIVRIRSGGFGLVLLGLAGCGVRLVTGGCYGGIS
jgi:hypothetical protein